MRLAVIPAARHGEHGLDGLMPDRSRQDAPSRVVASSHRSRLVAEAGMDRRRFLLSSVVGALVAPFGPGVGHASRVPRIGVLPANPGSEIQVQEMPRSVGS
jgi:hypothetical protein